MIKNLRPFEDLHSTCVRLSVIVARWPISCEGYSDVESSEILFPIFSLDYTKGGTGTRSILLFGKSLLGICTLKRRLTCMIISLWDSAEVVGDCTSKHLSDTWYYQVHFFDETCMGQHWKNCSFPLYCPLHTCEIMYMVTNESRLYCLERSTQTCQCYWTQMFLNTHKRPLQLTVTFVISFNAHMPCN